MSEPVVLVHGLIGTLQELVPLLEGQGVRAHAPDLLGYGSLSAVAPECITLPEQVRHLAEWSAKQGLGRFHLVGHSVGGAVAALFTHAFPERVASLVSVEGNFSLADAFWSGQVARMTPEEAEAMMDGFRADPAGWLARSGVPSEPRTLASASLLLSNQPGTTVQRTARSVVEVTGRPEYEAAVKAVAEGPVPFHLLAGERSRTGWDVPPWAIARAASETVLPGTGHLMMMEQPDGFVSTLLRIIRRPRG
ncbi:alpha/beta hydrolase [Microvirga sp. KLBC 81]|uniref:alpha/beta fold hydrolase n=1 Tax=Microvirga sp. KLBC 81 TaxID=1862707 RepID=UPI000D521A09|nr:alpha/beta hydrolase [Microvirga sp. KLBC 81]PVE23215.1 alpha/beta hydrolase [Microvirga sp. KLBC 81]